MWPDEVRTETRTPRFGAQRLYAGLRLLAALEGPWGSLVYPWWFGTTRLRFKSGRTHPPDGAAPIARGLTLQARYAGLNGLKAVADPSVPRGAETSSAALCGATR